MSSIDRMARRIPILRAMGVVACTVALGRAAADDPPARRIGLHGGNSVLWLYDHHPRPDGGQHLNFALRTTQQKIFVGPRDLRFLNRAVVRAAAVVGDDLHVFYDQSHRRYAVTNQRLRLHTEQPLQGDPVPLAIGGDPRGAALYAVVSGATAHATLARQRELLLTRRALRADDDDETPLPPEPPPVDATLSSHPRVLLRYAAGDWALVSPLPDAAGAVARVVIDGGGRVHVFTVAGEHLQQRMWSDGRWQDGPTVPTAAPALVDVVRDTARLGLVERGADDLAVRWLEDGTWAARTPLQGGAQGSAAAATLFGDALYLAALIDGQVRTGQWSVDGATVDAWTEVMALRTPVATHPQLRSFAAFGAMALLLGFVFWRRHDSVMLEIELPAAYRVAGFGRRLLSFIVDAALACVIMLPFAWYEPLVSWLQQYSALQMDTTQRLVLSKGVISSWFVVCTAHVLCCIVSEALYGTTPGKWIVGCRVLSESGARPRFGQILTRNVLRFVELFPVFEWLPPLVLILFTRNRQRLGDLVARTVIVEHIAPDRRRMGSTMSDHDRADPPA